MRAFIYACASLFISVFFVLISAQNKNAKTTPVWNITSSWDEKFQATTTVLVRRPTSRGWVFTFRFMERLPSFVCFTGVVENIDHEGSRTQFTVRNLTYNGNLKSGELLELKCQGTYPRNAVDPTPPALTISFQHRTVYRSPELRPPTTTTRISVPPTDIDYILRNLKRQASSSDPESQPDSSNKKEDAKLNIIQEILNNDNELYPLKDDNQSNNSSNNINVTANQTNSTVDNNVNRKETYSNKHVTNEDIERRNAEINSQNDLRNQQLHNSNNNTSSKNNSDTEERTSATNFSSTASNPSQQTATATSFSRNVTMTTTRQTPPTTNQETTTTTKQKPIPTWNVTTKYNYIEVLHKSLLFYEAQRSGRLPDDKRLNWTKSSALYDQGTGGEDLTGGYYDAGDYMKFGFPMAFTVTVLAWGVIEYWDAYEASGELKYALDALRWGADYFMKAHVSKFKLYGQVGNALKEHKSWEGPDSIPKRRPAYSISKSNPGSDLAGETSAALSAVSLAFRRKADGRVTDYVRELIQHASDLYVFAQNFGRKYHLSIRQAEKYYKSTDYNDEVAWAASWLYRATGRETFLTQAEGRYQNAGLFDLPKHKRFSWDDKRVGLQMLLAQISSTYKTKYEAIMESYCKSLRSPDTRKTAKGLVYLGAWSPLRYAANSAFVCLMAAESGIDVLANRNWAKQQIHYMLGDSGRSYVVGFGMNYPKQPHHRASSCPPDRNTCGFQMLESKKPNPIVLNGALVGGPDMRDRYRDKRKNYKQSEVAIDYNAGFQGAVAALQYNAIFPTYSITRKHEPWFNSTNNKGGNSSATRSRNVYVLHIMCFVTLSLWLATIRC